MHIQIIQYPYKKKKNNSTKRLNIGYII